MPAARGVKRAASKSSVATASTGPKNKKKRGAIQLEIPTLPKHRGRVLTCGQGDVGQLGLGEDVIETSKFKVVTALGDKIVDAYAGGMHTIALDSNGKVWTFGCNDEGALGRPTSDESDEGTPKAVSLPARAVAVSAGDSHSAALLDNGDVYAWGAFRDSHGSMGLVISGREGKSSKTPVKIDIGEPGVALASGGDHLVILSTSGSVFTMGCGEQGQLGRLSQRSASRDARQGLSALLAPSKVTLKAGASRVWAGYHATFVLDANCQKVFAWGLNNYGQLGITGEKRKTALYAPSECDAFSRVDAAWQSVAPGQHHSLALDANGQVYAIGRCEYGRLGLGSRVGDAEQLEPVPALSTQKCVSIAAGTSNSFAVTSTGSVLAWGMGSEGTLGTGASDDCAAPTAAATPPLSGRVPAHVSAGGQHTVLRVDEADAAAEHEREDTQRGEVSSTSATATAAQAKPDPHSPTPTPTPQPEPQKLNGDENKPETPMELDQTDNTEEDTEKKDEDVEMQSSECSTEKEEGVSEASPAEPVCPAPEGESKPETTDTASQETSDSETKSQVLEEQSKSDVTDQTELNGTADSQRVEPAPPEGLALASSA